MTRCKFIKPGMSYQSELEVDTIGVYGFFHGFTSDVVYSQEYPVEVPRAIVSDDDGYVHLVFPTEVRFLITPLEVLIHNIWDCLEKDDPKSKITEVINGLYKAKIQG